MAETEFSPEDHRFAAPRYFDDLAVGERFYIPSREHRYLLRKRAPSP